MNRYRLVECQECGCALGVELREAHPVAPELCSGCATVEKFLPADDDATVHDDDRESSHAAPPQIEDRPRMENHQ